jgi:SAM-dependent methyltransferase
MIPQTSLADDGPAAVDPRAVSPSTEQPPEPARAALLRIGFGFAAAQSLSVAAELGIADLLAAGSQTVEALAAATKTDPSALRRVLRLLAAEGIFSEEASGSFVQTQFSDALRADAPGSPRDFLRMIGREPFLAWGRLLDAVRSGQPSFELVYGAPRFAWLGKNPEAATLFQAAMVAVGEDVIEPVADGYEFGNLRLVVDVGGGHGRLLSAILARYPGVEGILFDLPSGIAAAEAGVGGPLPRCKLVAGDFFESVPTGGDAYIMKKVLHDWADDDAVRILDNCRRAMRPGGRILVAETVIPPGNAPDPIKVMDVNMLVVTGGRERTAEEFASLFARAGLRAGRVVPTGARISILEAFAA